MFYSLTRLFNDQADQHLRARLRTLYALLIAANLGAWAWAFANCPSSVLVPVRAPAT